MINCPGGGSVEIEEILLEVCVCVWVGVEGNEKARRGREKETITGVELKQEKEGGVGRT